MKLTTRKYGTNHCEVIYETSANNLAIQRGEAILTESVDRHELVDTINECFDGLSTIDNCTLEDSWCDLIFEVMDDNSLKNLKERIEQQLNK